MIQPPFVVNRKTLTLHSDRHVSPWLLDSVSPGDKQIGFLNLGKENGWMDGTWWLEVGFTAL